MLTRVGLHDEAMPWTVLHVILESLAVTPMHTWGVPGAVCPGQSADCSLL